MNLMYFMNDNSMLFISLLFIVLRMIYKFGRSKIWKPASHKNRFNALNIKPYVLIKLHRTFYIFLLIYLFSLVRIEPTIVAFTVWCCTAVPRLLNFFASRYTPYVAGFTQKFSAPNLSPISLHCVLNRETQRRPLPETRTKKLKY